jgi:hypothetical protein
MQPVNDDMDNLFRRAAENYPLNTGGADFSKIQQQLPVAEKALPKQERKRRFLWLWLLLLPVSFGIGYYYRSTFGNEQTTINTGKGVKTSKTDVSKIQTNSNLLSTDTINHLTTQPTTSTAPGLTSNAPSQTQAQPVPANTAPATVQQQKNYLKKNTNYSSPARTKPAASSSMLSGGGTVASQNAKQQTPRSKAGKNQDAITGAEFMPVPASTSSNETTNKEVQKAKPQISNTTTGSALTTPTDSSLNKTKATRLPDTTITAKTVTPKDKDSSTLKNPTSKQTKPPRYAYIGISLGGDVSSVRSGRIDGLSYSTGVVGGFRWGRHWAIETGVLWTQKKYYTDGKYVTVDKMGLPNHTTVINMDGQCSIIELPVLVRYHFAETARHNWFAAAGMSSYFLKQEEYYCLYKRYNTSYYAEKNYQNTSNNWFSILQISAGYQMQLGKRGSLRLEPFVKLPLAKVGVAKLPLTSKGINVGYTLPLK